MRTKSFFSSLSLVIVLILLLALPLPVTAGLTAGMPADVNVQILAFNDFHGGLVAGTGSAWRVATPGGNIDAGGAVYLATHINNLRATNPNTVLVSGGDLIGASPLISALFHDEPTIEMANLLGMNLATVGNHEFDEGWKELLRMQRGGCHPVDGCLDGDPFYGFDGKFLSANVVLDHNNQTLFPPFKVLTFDGAKVAFIGIGLESTPSIVVPSGVVGLTFNQEVETVNNLINMFKMQKVHNFVVIMHDGGTQTGFYNECVDLSSGFSDYVNALDPDVDVVISAHTHYAYNCLVGGKVVTQAMSNGRIISDIDLTINSRTRLITSMAANNVIVTRDVPADPAMQVLVDKYNTLVTPIAGAVIGSITMDITRTNNPAGESALGDVIADGQLFDTAPADRGGAVMAFMNPGGIRADLSYANQYYQELPGEITYGEAFSVQPFYNNMTTLNLTGDQIHTLLEQQWMGGNWPAGRVLQVSTGFTYEWSSSGDSGDRVDPATIMLNGVVIDPVATYRIACNNYLAAGGDGFSVLTQGTDLVFWGMDIDSLANYMGANSPIAPGPQNRITVVP